VSKKNFSKTAFILKITIGIIIIFSIYRPNISYAKTSSDKRVYMIGYSYAGLISNLGIMKQYLSEDLKIAYFKILFNIGIFSGEILLEFSNKDVAENFSKKDVAGMAQILAPLSELPHSRIQYIEIKKRFSLFDKIFTPYSEMQNRFSYLLTIGVYCQMLTYYNDSIIIPKTTLQVWEIYISTQSEKYNMPSKFLNLTKELIALLNKYENESSKDSKNKLSILVSQKGKEIHNLLKNKDLNLLSR
jgi:hypothetical protein